MEFSRFIIFSIYKKFVITLQTFCFRAFSAFSTAVHKKVHSRSMVLSPLCYQALDTFSILDSSSSLWLLQMLSSQFTVA